MRSLLLTTTIILILSCNLFAQQSAETPPTDTTMVVLNKTITVTGHRVTQEQSRFPFEKEHLNQVLTQNGFSLIKKGVFLAQDIQADGFKRDDITVVVDGERYHSACPNRMDSPIARSNSLEMSTIELTKSSSAHYSGLGGSIAYRRALVGAGNRMKAGFSQSLGGYESSDLGFALTSHHNRVVGRYVTGSGYTDAEGQDFVDRYGYRQNYDYQLAEISLTGRKQKVRYHADFTYTDNVMFPYLRMDERLNRVFSGSVEYRHHKLYANYTDHLMDNGLRVAMGSMTTDAQNLTLGLNGPMYELYYRRWVADNVIATPMATITNDLMPTVNQVTGSVFQEESYKQLTYWGRAGLTRFSIGEKSREPFYEAVHGDISTDRTFLNLGIGAAIRKPLSAKLTGTGIIDIAAEQPSAQSLYIAVRKPTGKPSWSGNPDLTQPVRASVRTKLVTHRFSLEGSASYVWDYADLTSVMVDDQPYMTYKNFDALIYAVNFDAGWDYFNLVAGYTWAERRDTKTPLAEIVPFHVISTVKLSPVDKGDLFVRHTYNDAQTRVDELLDETPTGSWNRFDFGGSYDFGPGRINLEVQNLFDEFYSQHLSYLRDPFASGSRVYEPGRTLMLSFILDSVN